MAIVGIMIGLLAWLRPCPVVDRRQDVEEGVELDTIGSPGGGGGTGAGSRPGSRPGSLP